MSKLHALKLAKKTIALSLILSSFFTTYTSVKSLIFIYPHLNFIANPNQLYLELMRKAIYISSSLFVDTLYGFILLVKPTSETKYIHLVFGLLLLLFSFLFFRLHALDTFIQNWLFFPLT